MDKPQWLDTLRRFEKSDLRKSVGQLLNSVLPYIGIWAAMCAALAARWPYWLVLIMALPASGFLARIFIILHDCGHGSFSSSPRLNAVVGYFCGFLVFTSFPDFRRSHAIHHATVGNLDKRGAGGDIWTMTLAEYRAAPAALRLGYRLFRNPVILFFVIPPLFFFFDNRRTHGKVRRPVLLGTIATDLVLAGIVTLAAFTMGLGPYILVQVPCMTFAAIIGVWLFYIQHQYPEVYWKHDSDWDRVKASLEGSSFYDLPPLLRWFTGNIGYHHIHHLDPKIPNYFLKPCYEGIPETRTVHPLRLIESLRSLSLALYDEAQGRLVGFRAARQSPSRSGLAAT